MEQITRSGEICVQSCIKMWYEASRGGMILDPDPKSDSQLFGDSGSSKKRNCNIYLEGVMIPDLNG